MTEIRFFIDLGMLFGAALLGGALAQALRQPLILGYLLGGILVGPFTPGPSLSDPRTFQLFAEIGVVLLLFSIGVEFSLAELLRVRRLALFGVPVGMALITALAVLIGTLLGWPRMQSLVVGAAVSVASTMVLLKSLQERGAVEAPYGRVAVGISLAGDLATVVLVVLIPALGASGPDRLEGLLWGLARAVVIMAPVFWLARRVVPRLLARVVRTRNMELFFLVAIAVAIGTAALTAGLGLSLALGAFLAGLVISESEFAHEALARLLPMRDIFVAVFFVSLGTLIRPAALVEQWPAVLALSLLVFVGAAAIWSAVVRLAGYAWTTAIGAALSLNQIGEFSYILAGVGRAQGLVSGAMYEAVLATSLVTILSNGVIGRRVPRWMANLPRWTASLPRWTASLRDVPRNGEESGEVAAAMPAQVMICGFGRVGREVADALEAFEISYTVVDLDPQATRDAAMRGARTVFGDAGRTVTLRRAGAEHVRLAVVAIPDFEAAHRCVGALRRIREDLPVIARVHQQRHHGLITEAGATEVIQPEVEAALTIVRHSLDRLGVDHQAGRRYLEQARSHWPEAFRLEGAAEPLTAEEVVVLDARLAGRRVEEVGLQARTGATVVSLTRPHHREVINPAGVLLRAGDRLLVVGTPDQIAALRRLCGDRPLDLPEEAAPNV